MEETMNQGPKGYEGSESFDKHKVSQSSQADHTQGSDNETAVWPSEQKQEQSRTEQNEFP